MEKDHQSLEIFVQVPHPFDFMELLPDYMRMTHTKAGAEAMTERLFR